MASASSDEKKPPATADLSRLESHQIGETETVTVGTHRNIKSRHAQMIAIGGTIGTGLFVGSGQALARGGPGFLLIAYILISLLVYAVVTAIAEIGAYLPVTGTSMASYTVRFASPSLGFALGWLYFYSFAIIVAYEIVAASIVINFWPNSVHIAVFITIMLIVIVGLNFCPVAVYGETEFWFASIKIIMLCGLLLLSLILMLGGGPSGDRFGFRYWNNPGAFNEYITQGSGGRFTAFLSIWVFSAFSFFFGPELIIFTAGEMQNPRKNIPVAARRFFYRLIFFYVIGALAIGIICQSNSDGLTSGSGNANSSPWVIAIRNAGISGLPSVVNAGILTSAWSSGNAYLYMSSRALVSLAASGNAPKIFARCNRWGVPVYAVATSSLFAPLAYLSCGSQAGDVFNYFVNLTNTAGFTSWAICCVTYLRFRKACQAQGVEVSYRSKIQPYAAQIALGFFVFLLLVNGFTVFYPGNWSTSYFITNYLGIPIFLILWIGHKLVRGRRQPWLLAPSQIDLVSGLREVEEDEMKYQDAKVEGGKWYGKIARIWE